MADGQTGFHRARQPIESVVAERRPTVRRRDGIRDARDPERIVIAVRFEPAAVGLGDLAVGVVGSRRESTIAPGPLARRTKGVLAQQNPNVTN